MFIALSSASLNENTCDKIFYFLIENEGDYTVSEINQLVKEINSSLDELENYIEDFEESCARQLPFKENIKTVEINNTKESCPVEINKSILWDSYSLDTSIPFFNIYTSKLDCENSQYYKWFISIDRKSDIFMINGIKIYWFLFPFIFIMMVLFIRDMRKTDSIFTWFKRKSIKG